MLAITHCGKCQQHFPEFNETIKGHMTGQQQHVHYTIKCDKVERVNDSGITGEGKAVCKID